MSYPIVGDLSTTCEKVVEWKTSFDFADIPLNFDKTPVFQVG